MDMTTILAVAEQHAEVNTGASLAVGIGVFVILLLLLFITLQFDRNR